MQQVTRQRKDRLFFNQDRVPVSLDFSFFFRSVILLSVHASQCVFVFRHSFLWLISVSGASQVQSPFRWSDIPVRMDPTGWIITVFPLTSFHDDIRLQWSLLFIIVSFFHKLNCDRLHHKRIPNFSFRDLSVSVWRCIGHRSEMSSTECFCFYSFPSLFVAYVCVSYKSKGLGSSSMQFVVCLSARIYMLQCSSEVAVIRDNAIVLQSVIFLISDSGVSRKVSKYSLRNQ